MPDLDIVYFGDSAWCPYGVRPAEEIQQRVSSIADLLLERGCQALVIACNSATIAAVEGLRANYPVPIVGMEPGVRPAAALTKSGVVGVFATEASLRGEKFHRLLLEHAKSVKVITQPCPEFVRLVERGELEGEGVERAVRDYMAPLLNGGADVIVLGCTHYPFLAPVIRRIAGSEVEVIDTGLAVARQLQRVLEGRNDESLQGLEMQAKRGGALDILTSGDPGFYERFITALPDLSHGRVVASGQMG